jgi:hypothetical protein
VANTAASSENATVIDCCEAGRFAAHTTYRNGPKTLSWLGLH